MRTRPLPRVQEGDVRGIAAPTLTGAREQTPGPPVESWGALRGPLMAPGRHGGATVFVPYTLPGHGRSAAGDARRHLTQTSWEPTMSTALPLSAAALRLIDDLSSEDIGYASAFSIFTSPRYRLSHRVWQYVRLEAPSRGIDFS